MLKGAMLFRLWSDQPHRATRDLDLLGKGDSSLEAVAQVFREVCELAVEDDGLRLDPGDVSAGRIKEDQEYEGVRVTCQAFLGQARISLQIDVGFGDTVVPIEPPIALTTEFGIAPNKVKQWEAFIRKGKLDAGGIALEQVCALLRDFLMPPVQALASGQTFPTTWSLTGRWEEPDGR